MGIGFFILAAVLACLGITVLVARSASRKVPAVAAASGGSDGSARSAVRGAGGATPAGWYPDPSQAGRSAYWDGTAWTGDTRPG